MMEPITFENLPVLLLGGVPVLVLTFIVVQALKLAGMVRDEKQAQIANIVVSLIFGGLWAATQFAPQISPVVAVLATALAGSLGSALLYKGASWVTDKWRAPLPEIVQRE